MASISLNSIRNAFAPINSLPRETLAIIFGMVASLDRPSRSSFLPSAYALTNPPSHSWIAVTHVCRYWRETAFAFPTLWCTISTSSPLASLAFLARASTAPLNVYLRDAVCFARVRPSLDQGRLLQSLATHSAHLAELHVQPTFRYGTALLTSFSSRPAPLLTTLSIALGMSASQDQDSDKTLPTLFAGQTPRLARLTLCNFARWRSDEWSLGQSLTHLCLYDQHIRARLPTHEFVAFLASCTLLEQLVIIEAGPSLALAPAPSHSELFSPRDPPQPLPLSLPHLRLLHVGNWSSVHVVSEFLSHLVLPYRATIEVWADVLFHGTETLTALLPSSLSSLHPLHNLTAIHLMYRPTLRDAPQLFSVSGGVLVVHFHFIANTSGELLASIFRLLDTCTVEELTVGVDCDPDFGAGWWRETFKSMPRLTKLNIMRRRSRNILSALSLSTERHTHTHDLTSRNEPEDELEILCPALSTLLVTDDSALASIRLFALAQSRTAHGAPIRRLTIVNATPGLKYHMFDQKLREEMEDLHTYIDEVEFAQSDAHTVPSLPVGWPSEPFVWAMEKKNGKSRTT